jgi:LysM repeat protein
MRFAAVFLLTAFVTLSPVALHAQPAQSPAVELANLREDVRLLIQRVGQLSLRVEQLEAENERLTRTAAGAERNFATLTQLNTAIADLARELRAADAANRSEILAAVATQMETLARQTNAALDAAARGRATAAAPSATTFSDNFTKEGVTYTVVSGDTIARIAQKTGAKVQDIINANRIADPTRIQVGQVLFIPGGR